MSRVTPRPSFLPLGRLHIAPARAGRRHLEELTGRQASAVTSVEPAEEEGGWFVAVEMVEERHVPSNADLLGLYEAEIDADESLLANRRLRSYARGRGDDGGS